MKSKDFETLWKEEKGIFDSIFYLFNRKLFAKKFFVSGESSAIDRLYKETIRLRKIEELKEE